MIAPSGNPLTWALFLLGAVALAFGLRSWLGVRSVARDAVDDYAYKLGQDMIPAGLSEDRYVALYRRANNPRAAIYVASVLGAILLTTPILFMVLEWALRMMYNYSGQSRVIEPGYLVWQFMIYFLVIGSWVGMAYLAARHYHRRKPGPLHYEIEQALLDEEV